MPIKRATFSSSKKQLKDLFSKHNQEIASITMHDPKVDIDETFYKYLEQTNKYLGYLIYNDDKVLIGYVSIFMYNHHHHKYIKCATTDAFYIDPKYRSIKSFRWVSEAFVEAEKVLIEEYRVQYFYFSSSAKRDLKFLAHSLGFDPCDIVYVKYLGN